MGKDAYSNKSRMIIYFTTLLGQCAGPSLANPTPHPFSLGAVYVAMNYRNVLPYAHHSHRSTMTGSLNVHKRVVDSVLYFLYMVLCEARLVHIAGQLINSPGFSSAQTSKANRMTRRLCGMSKNQGG